MILLGAPLVCGWAIRLTAVLAFFGFLVGNGTDSVCAVYSDRNAERG